MPLCLYCRAPTANTFCNACENYEGGWCEQLCEAGRAYDLQRDSEIVRGIDELEMQRLVADFES